MHLWREDIDALIEMRCDEKVIEHMDEEEQFRYTVMLKDMAERIVNRRRTPAMTLDESMADEWVSNSFILKEPDGRYRLFTNYEFRGYLTEDQIVSEEYRELHIFEGEPQG